MNTTLYSPDREEFAELLVGEPRYRLDQVWAGLYLQLAATADISNVPKALRERLAHELPLSLTQVVRRVSDGGDTVKYLWELRDGNRIETVLMLYPDRVTVCVSSQAGCAMACGFCATGQAGFSRQLSVGEIVEQVVVAARDARSMQRRLANVVFMGMGEPMANEAAVWGATERFHSAVGLSARHITISTVGIIPGIRTLSTRQLPVNLAVSLHAVTKEIRDEIVPINRKYGIEELLRACAEYPGISNARRMTFEYVMLKDKNDSDEEAHELVRLIKRYGLPAKVNLIPFNPWPGAVYECSDPERIKRFSNIIFEAGISAPIRTPRGRDIMAACGQLKSSSEKKSRAELDRLAEEKQLALG